MDQAAFKKIESEDEFVELLKKHDLFREDDVTFDDFDEQNNYVYTGDDFRVDPSILDELEIFALLIEGNVEAELLIVSDILADFGVLCVTGNVHCQNLDYRTESTGVVVGGNLEVDKIFIADCGNSVLQVNGDFNAKLGYVAQCSVEVRGQETFGHDDSVTLDDLRALGVNVDGHDDPQDAIDAHFESLAD